jgi:endonuclease/exonuclease/phosphatase family metal-dependent hydrolase
MRIVSWNMGCATKHYCSVRDEAWRFLLGLAPDVVLVQEAMLDVPAWLRKEGTLCIRPAYDGQGWGSGVLVRGAAAKELPLVSPGSFIVAAEVEQPGGSILVASIHVCPDKHLAKNMGTLGDVLPPLLAGRRFIVGGDLNSGRHFDAIRKRSTHRTFLEKLAPVGAHDCHFALHRRETQSYWGRAIEAYQVDHLFVDGAAAPSIRASDVVTTDDTRRLSDHSPLVLEVG